MPTLVSTTGAGSSPATKISFSLSQTAWGRHVYAVGDDPESARLSGVASKRVLLSDDFYPTVSSDAVTLVRGALAGVEGSTLVGSDGSRHEADALVLATGFASTRQPTPPSPETRSA